MIFQTAGWLLVGKFSFFWMGSRVWFPGLLLLVPSMPLMLVAFHRLFGVWQNLKVIYVLTIPSILGISFFAYIEENEAVCVVLGSLSSFIFALYTAFSVSGKKFRLSTGLRRGVFWVYLFIALTLLWRLVDSIKAASEGNYSADAATTLNLLMAFPFFIIAIAPSLVFFSACLQVSESRTIDSEARFAELINSVDGILWQADARTADFTFVSAKAERLLGYSQAEWLTPGFWTTRMHPGDLSWAPAYCQDKSLELIPHEFEYRMLSKDGKTVWLRDIVTVEAEEGRPRWLRGVMVDITEKKLAQEKLQRLTFMYELLSNCRRIIAQTSTEKELFDAIVRLCVTNNYIPLAWIGLPEDDSSQVRIAAAAGSVTAYLDEVRVSLSPGLEEGRGPTGTAMREKHDVIVNYPDSLPSDKWSERRQKYGLHSYAAITFRLSGIRVGSLNLYAAEEGFFTAEIIGLFDQLGADLGRALDRIEAERWRSFAEQALRENQLLLDFALEATVDAVWDYDVPSGTVRFFRHWEAMLGYDRGELPNDISAWESHVHPDDLRLSEAMLERYQRGDIPAFDMRIRVRNKYGQYLWVKDRGMIVERDATGQASRIIGTLKNIDVDVKRAEESQQNAALLDAIFEAAPVSIAVLNAQKKLLRANPASGRIAGVTTDAELQKALTSLEFFFPDGTAYPQGEVPIPLALPEIERDYTAVFGFRSSTGQKIRWVSMTSRYLEPVGLIVRIATEITEVIESESALRESEQKFRHIFESAPIGITLFDSAGNPTSLNPEVMRQSGIEGTVSMADVADWRFIDESGRTVALEEMPLYVSVRQKRPVRDFIFGRQFPERVRWFSSTMVPMADIGMYAGYLVELTDLVNAKREVSQLAASLEETVAQRTRELQEINGELEAFSYSLSHDLKAPLTRAESWLNIIDHEFRTALGEKGKGMLVYVRNEIGAMKRMNEAMLALSRVARSNIEPVNASLTAKATEIIGQLREEHGDAVIEFSVPENAVVHADSELLRILLRNLLENAVKFSRGQNPIRIEIGCTAEDQHFLCFVRDHGVGFDMRYADKLFAPFQRLHAETEFPGTGIGLATAQRIVHRHGGKIWAESQPGQGTTVFFTLSRGSGES
ncbi:MAG: GAF domain-containing sensor histidine kinase [Spirochaetota bacterium]